MTQFIQPACGCQRAYLFHLLIYVLDNLHFGLLSTVYSTHDAMYFEQDNSHRSDHETNHMSFLLI